MKPIHRIAITTLAWGMAVASPAQFIWLNPSGGLFATPTNWIGGIAPGINTGLSDGHVNSAAFPTVGAPSNMPVSFTTLVTLNRLYVRAHSTVTSTSNITLNSPGSEFIGPLTLFGGLQGEGAVSVSGLLTISGGTHSGSGVVSANGGVKINPSSNTNLRKPVDAYGASSWDSGIVYNSDFRPFRNFGSLLITGGTEWRDTPWTNWGTLTKTSTAATRFFTSDFRNGGSVAVQAGSLTFDRSSALGHSGTFTVATGATLTMNGTVSFNSGSSVSGLGQLSSVGSTLNFQSGSTLAVAATSLESSVMTMHPGSFVSGNPGLVLTNAGLHFQNAGSHLGSLSASGSTISATNDVVVNGAMTFGGTLNGLGSWEILSTLTFNGGVLDTGGSITANGGIALATSSAKDIRRDLLSKSGGSWSGGSIFSSAGFVNDGTFNITGNNTWTGGTGFTNNGTVTRSAGTGIARFTGVPFSNNGQVNVSSGTLRIDSSSSTGHGGDFNIAPGAVLQMQNGAAFKSGSLVNGSGQLLTTAGTLSFESGSTLSTGSAQIESAHLNFLTGSSVTGNPAVTLVNSSLNVLNGTGVSLGSLTATNGVVNAAQALTVTGPFSVQGSVIQGAGSITVGGQFSYSGGLVAAGGTFRSNGGALLHSPALKDLKRGVIFGGLTQWSDGDIIGTGNQFSNTGTFELIGDRNWQGGSLSNSGSLRKTSGAGVAVLSFLDGFTNSGTMTASSGVLNISGDGTHSGSFSANGSSTIQLGGNHAFVSPSQLGGTGSYLLQNGAYTFGLGTSVLSDTTLQTGTLNLEPSAYIQSNVGLTLITSTGNFDTGQPVELGSLKVQSSSLNANNGLTVTGSTEFLSGSIIGNQALSFAGGLQLGGNGAKNFGHSFTLGGESQWTGGNVTMTNQKIVQHNGTFHANNANQWNGGVFNNTGTYIKSGAGITRIAYPGPLGPYSGSQFSNSGSVQVNSGTLQVGGWGSHNGQFTISSGAILSFDAPQTFRTGAVVNSQGTTRWESGITNFNAGSSFNGVLAMLGGTVNFNPGATASLPANLDLQTGGTLNLSTGTQKTFSNITLAGTSISGSDPLRVTGILHQKSGSLSGTGQITIGTDGSLLLDTSSAKVIGRPVVAEGPTQFNAGALQMIGGGFTNQNTVTINGDLSWNFGAIVNNGTIRKIAGTGAGTLAPDSLNNQGTIKVESGRLTVSGLTNFNPTSRVLNGGLYRAENGAKLQLSNVSNGIVTNAGTIELIGQGSQLLDSGNQDALRTVTTNFGHICVKDGANTTLFNGLTNTGTVEVRDTDSHILVNGPLNMNGGLLRVDGTLAATQVSINGGLVVGNGLTQSPVSNSGELNPGNSVGVFNVAGNFIQSPTGRLRIEVEGTLPGDADKVIISGNAHFAGELVVDAPSALFIPAGTRYRIVEISGVRSGAFAVVPPSAAWTVDYGSNYIDIVRAGSSETSMISGRVVLGQFDYQNGMPAVTLSLYRDGTLIQSASVVPATNGTWAYSFPTDLRGSYTLYASTGGFLRQGRPIAITSPNVTGMDFTLVNGDPDMSGEIDAADIDLVISAFGSQPTDPTYIPFTDVDNSREVDAADIDIVISNFGAVGD